MEEITSKMEKSLTRQFMKKKFLKEHAWIERAWNGILWYTLMFHFLIRVWLEFELHSRACAKKHISEKVLLWTILTLV